MTAPECPSASDERERDKILVPLPVADIIIWIALRIAEPERVGSRPDQFGRLSLFPFYLDVVI